VLDREGEGDGEGGEGRGRGSRSPDLCLVYIISLYSLPQESPVWSIKNSANMTALGYLVGPTIGSLLYSATHPSLARGSPSPLEVMDKAFYDHIKANRASPAFQSVNNPAPDFYGEKVCPSSSPHHI
jgi:hypothetical protein